MVPKVRQIDLEGLKETGRFLRYRDQLVLNDNLDMLGEPDFLLRMLPDPPLPAKFRFTTFLVCREGKADIQIDGEWFGMRRNSVLSIAPRCIVEEVTTSSDFKAALIAAATETPLSEGKEASIQMIKAHLSEPFLVQLETERATTGLTILDMIRKIILKPIEVLKDEALYGALLLLSSIVARALFERGDKLPGGKGSDPGDVMSRFLQELNQRFREQRSVAYYANFLCMSPKHFAQVVHRKSGKFAKDWIRGYVIREAKTLLKGGNLSVEQVSEYLHFPNPSYFGKYFKAAVGCTPKDYGKERK